MNIKQEYFESLFCDETDGICQYAFGMRTGLDLCESCYKIVLEDARCKAKTKFILKHSFFEFRDVAVCGTHKNMLVNSTFRSDDWEVIAERGYRRFIRTMVAEDLSRPRLSDMERAQRVD